jgi:hypothetical protein
MSNVAHSFAPDARMGCQRSKRPPAVPFRRAASSERARAALSRRTMQLHGSPAPRKQCVHRFRMRRALLPPRTSGRATPTRRPPKRHRRRPIALASHRRECVQNHPDEIILTVRQAKLGEREGRSRNFLMLPDSGPEDGLVRPRGAASRKRVLRGRRRRRLRSVDSERSGRVIELRNSSCGGRRGCQRARQQWRREK